MNSTNQGAVVISDNTANPAPLGLLGFGMTTVLLNLHNIGLFPVNSMIMGMGLFVGGLAQVIAGVQEWKKNNTFGATAFTAYGFFWIALVFTWVLPKISFVTINLSSNEPQLSSLATSANELSMACFLLIWGLFTLGMFVGTLKLNRLLQVVFGTLTILFFLLASRDFLIAAENPAGPVIGVIAGCVGLICGLSAFYGAIAQILNEVFGKSILPLGAKKKSV